VRVDAERPITVERVVASPAEQIVISSITGKDVGVTVSA